jgi:hypothetical protein
VLVVLALIAVSSTLLPRTTAEEKPASKSYLRYEGIDGSIILTGSTIPDAARDRFFDFAGKGKANIVLLGRADDNMGRIHAEQLAERWKASKATVTVITGDGAEAKFLDTMPKATGV